VTACLDEQNRILEQTRIKTAVIGMYVSLTWNAAKVRVLAELMNIRQIRTSPAAHKQPRSQRRNTQPKRTITLK
jgi:hypothetical protein